MLLIYIAKEMYLKNQSICTTAIYIILFGFNNIVKLATLLRILNRTPINQNYDIK